MHFKIKENLSSQVMTAGTIIISPESWNWFGRQNSCYYKRQNTLEIWQNDKGKIKNQILNLKSKTLLFFSEYKID